MHNHPNPQFLHADVKKERHIVSPLMEAPLEFMKWNYVMLAMRTKTKGSWCQKNVSSYNTQDKTKIM